MALLTLVFSPARTLAAPGDELFATVGKAYPLRLKKIPKKEKLKVDVWIFKGIPPTTLVRATQSQVKYDTELDSDEVQDFSITPKISMLEGQAVNIMIVVSTLDGTKAGSTVVAVQQSKDDTGVKGPVKSPIGVGRR